MNVYDGIEDPHVFEILARLRFIGKTQKGQRINVSTMNHEDESMYTSTYRTLITRDESREKSLRFFKETVEEALRIVQRRLISERDYDHRIAHTILYNIREAKKGIQEMIRGETYRQDTMFVSKVEAYLVLLDNCILDHDKRIADVTRKKTELAVATPNVIPPPPPNVIPPPILNYTPATPTK